jgi:hypothetical protein
MKPPPEFVVIAVLLNVPCEQAVGGWSRPPNAKVAPELTVNPVAVTVKVLSTEP